ERDTPRALSTPDARRSRERHGARGNLRVGEQHDRGEHAAAERPDLRRERPQDALVALLAHKASRFAMRSAIVAVTGPARKFEERSEEPSELQSRENIV